MEIWLSIDNKAEQHQLPVLPSEFEVISNNMNTVVNINEIGEINLAGREGLQKITISCFFPDQDYPFVQSQKRHDPYTYVKNIKRWSRSLKPIRLIITETPINCAMLIESFSYKEKDGSGDVYYVLELAEYVFTGVKKDSNTDYNKPSEPPKVEDTKVDNIVAGIIADNIITNTTDSLKPSLVKPVEREEDKKLPDTYTVKRGDTLTTIAKKITGNASNYKQIAEKNDIKNPDNLSVGQVLKI